MSEHEHDEQAAQQAEQDRLDRAAAENEAVRRAEHPEEFADETDGTRTVAPVAPASGTGADTTTTTTTPAASTTSSPPAVGDAADVRAHDLTTLERLEHAAGELRQKLFGPPTL